MPPNHTPSAEARAAAQAWLDARPESFHKDELIRIIDAAHADLRQPIDSYACQLCGRADGLDAVLLNEEWEKISAYADNNLLCLWCIDRIALKLGITTSVSLHFAGKAITGTSQSKADMEHIRKLVSRLQLLEDGVRRLREAERAFDAACNNKPAEVITARHAAIDAAQAALFALVGEKGNSDGN